MSPIEAIISSDQWLFLLRQGTLGGFSGGIEWKKKLLELERNNIK